MNQILSALRVFQSRKMAGLLGLGFASGLPLLLTKDTLQAWMTSEKVDISTVVWFSLVSLPYSLKFLWSPLVDRYQPSWFNRWGVGRRRSWILFMQLGLILSLGLMFWHQPRQSLWWLGLNALLIAFLSATQDIAFDAYRTDVLEPAELGPGAAVPVLGYRAAMLTTGSIAFLLAPLLGWQGVYVAMAALMSLGIICLWFAPEPTGENLAPASLQQAVVLPFIDFFQRFGSSKAILILVFILLYRLGDSLAGVVTVPFLLQVGFRDADIGAVRGGLGLAATLVGTLCGGAILTKIGVNRSLWIFGVLQALSNLTYWGLALVGQANPTMTQKIIDANGKVVNNLCLGGTNDFSGPCLGLVATINVENFCIGLGSAAFVGFLISLCNRQFSATQYALLSSLMAVSRDIIVAPAGELVKLLSMWTNSHWAWFFLITVVAALPGLCMLPFFAPWRESAPPSAE
jgi:PAT family beta-lactamase induction signal transducer AmpG